MEKICETIPDIIIDLKYMKADNFIGEPIYDKAYLIVWDAYRPLEVQRVFWDKVKDERFVAHPDKGSKHNRGCAVDLTLADLNGMELEMPSKFDDFSNAARADRDDLSSEVEKRLKSLQSAMVKAGFLIENDEWWHFNDTDWEQYDIV